MKENEPQRLDFAALAKLVTELVPFNGLVGARVTELTSTRAVAVLPDNPSLRNHVGTQHAAALFSIAELAAGAAFAGALAPVLGEVTFVMCHAEMSYERPARGMVRATALVPSDCETLRQEIERLGRSRMAVHADVADETGAVSCRLTATYHVRRRSKPG